MPMVMNRADATPLPIPADAPADKEAEPENEGPRILVDEVASVVGVSGLGLFRAVADTIRVGPPSGYA